MDTDEHSPQELKANAFADKPKGLLRRLIEAAFNEMGEDLPKWFNNILD